MGANTPRLSRISGAPLRYEWAISLSALRNYYCGVIDAEFVCYVQSAGIGNSP